MSPPLAAPVASIWHGLTTYAPSCPGTTGIAYSTLLAGSETTNDLMQASAAPWPPLYGNARKWLRRSCSLPSSPPAPPPSPPPPTMPHPVVADHRELVHGNGRQVQRCLPHRVPLHGRGAARGVGSNRQGIYQPTDAALQLRDRRSAPHAARGFTWSPFAPQSLAASPPPHPLPSHPPSADHASFPSGASTVLSVAIACMSLSPPSKDKK